MDLVPFLLKRKRKRETKKQKIGSRGETLRSKRFGIGRRRLAGRITGGSSDSRGEREIERERKFATTLNKRIPPPWTGLQARNDDKALGSFANTGVRQRYPIHELFNKSESSSSAPR